MRVYAWLIDLIHRQKNCPTGMISGWVQKVTEHRGTIQYTWIDGLFTGNHNSSMNHNYEKLEERKHNKNAKNPTK